MDPVVYDRILLNEGNAWKPDSNTVVIPYTGYYLVHFGGGVSASQHVQQYLYSSGTKVTTLYQHNTVHNGIDTLSKTVVRRFSAGKVLKIKTDYSTFSNGQMQTAFIGLLLYKG